MKTVVSILSKDTLEWSGKRYARNPDGEALLASAVADAGFTGILLRRPEFSVTQTAALDLCHKSGHLTRFPGGYWTTPEGWSRRDPWGSVPSDLHAGTQTIQALIRKGAMVEHGFDACGRPMVRIADAAYE